MMLHPNTGIKFGEEVDEVRKENAALRAALAAARADIRRLCPMVHSLIRELNTCQVQGEEVVCPADIKEVLLTAYDIHCKMKGCRE